MRTTRHQTTTLPASLRKIRTAFSPSRVSSSSRSDSSTSPLSARSSNSFSRFTTFSNLSNISLSIRSVIRRSPSSVELEQEEERRLCNDELLDLIEPRPSLGPAHGGIEDVLFGRF
ncbi:hypothetical protein M8818_006885 [Zalaria obscura]|uniref:Uncharacterized protein n=1 Tax=Zalaria obscura TaxID=2024903 RepID=A0ACC3S550_9PEZI